jgi:hypothetical protein
MPAREPLPVRSSGARARVAPPVPGRTVLFVMFAVGLSVVGGVATFAALTRGPRHPHPQPGSALDSTGGSAGAEPSR